MVHPLYMTFPRWCKLTKGRSYVLPEWRSVVKLEDRDRRFIGALADRRSHSVILIRGDMMTFSPSFRMFAPSGDGTTPTFQDKDIALIDGGLTLRFGKYEADADVVSNAVCYGAAKMEMDKISPNQKQADVRRERHVKALCQVVRRVLLVGGDNFSGKPLECYCGGIMTVDGNLDEKGICLPCRLLQELVALEG